MGMKLPKEPTLTRKEGFPNSAVWLIYGDPKVGKSTLASQFPSPIFLATEPGLANIECYQLEITSYQELIEAGQLLKKGDHDFQTVIIDTIDVMGDIVQDFTCDQLEIDHPADAGYGKGWYEFRKKLMGALTSFSLLGMHLVMVSHSKERVDEGGDSGTKILPALTGKLAESVMGFADVIFYCQAKRVDGKIIRTITTEGCNLLIAGSRYSEIPAELPMSFEAVKRCFTGTPSESESANEEGESEDEG
jgi:hypothetical protein